MSKYYGQFSPPVDQVIYENYFKGIKGGYFIDCGAAEGALFSCTKFFDETMGWDGICIEPSVAFEDLVIDRPKMTNLNLALSDHDGFITFAEVVHSGGRYTYGLPPGGSSHYDEYPDLKNFVASFGYQFTEKEVPTLTFRTLVERYNITRLDLMTIDVEGHEVAVISGMVNAPTLPNVVCVEYPFIGLDTVTNVLTDLGYRFDFVSFNNAFFSIGMPTKEWFGKTEVWKV